MLPSGGVIINFFMQTPLLKDRHVNKKKQEYFGKQFEEEGAQFKTSHEDRFRLLLLFCFFGFFWGGDSQSSETTSNWL